METVNFSLRRWKNQATNAASSVLGELDRTSCASFNAPLLTVPHRHRRDVLYLQHDRPIDDLSLIASAGWTVHVARTIAEALAMGQKRTFAVGLADARCVTEDEWFSQWLGLRRTQRFLPWIALVSQQTDFDERTRARIWQNFYDFHTVPVDIARLLFTLGHAHGMMHLVTGHDDHAADTSQAEPILHRSPVMNTFLEQIDKAARTDATTLLHGESGTGKELAARTLHSRSARAREPFVTVNCGAISPTLIHAELFGYEKGAFTGANKRKLGKIEAAHRGTVFLDEIGDLAADLQTSLLRFLQEGTIERVGGYETIAVDARVIAATHVDLEQAVAQGRFREDLYYRLNVIKLAVPPLRERRPDIEVLVTHFFHKFAKERNPCIRGFAESAMTAMYHHTWPGNVRELMNRVRQALIMSENAFVTAEDLGLNAVSVAAEPATLAEVRASAEKTAIVRALERNCFKVPPAAEMLGVSRATLYRLVERYQLCGE